MNPSVIDYPTLPTSSLINASFDYDYDFNNQPTRSTITLSTPPTPSTLKPHRATPSLIHHTLWSPTRSNLHHHLHPPSTGSDNSSSPIPTSTPCHSIPTHKPPLKTHQKRLLHLAFTSRLTWDDIQTLRKWMPDGRSAMFKPDYTSTNSIHFITVTLNPQDKPQYSSREPMLLFKGVDIVRRQCFDVLVSRQPTQPSIRDHNNGGDGHDDGIKTSYTKPTAHVRFRFEVVPPHPIHDTEILASLHTFIASPRRAVKFHSFPREYQVLWDDFKSHIDHEVSRSQRRMSCEVGEIITASKSRQRKTR
jgi:hypothetical protein